MMIDGGINNNTNANEHKHQQPSHNHNNRHTTTNNNNNNNIGNSEGCCQTAEDGSATQPAPRQAREYDDVLDGEENDVREQSTDHNVHKSGADSAVLWSTVRVEQKCLHQKRAEDTTVPSTRQGQA